MEGIYEIKIKTRDIHSMESRWSNILQLNLSRKKMFFASIYERIQHCFQMFNKLIYIGD